MMMSENKVGGFTESQISAAGRVLAGRSAEACNVDKDDNWKIYGGDFIEDARAAIRALASQPAAPVAAEVPVHQPCDVREHDFSDLVTTLRQLSEAYPVEIWPELTKAQHEEMGVLIDRASAAMGRSMGKTLTRAADAIEALATTRPSAAPQGKPVLMAYVATDLDGHADVGFTIEEAKRRAGHGCDTIIALHDISAEFVELEGNHITDSPAILAASGGAVAVPDWISVDERLPENLQAVSFVVRAGGPFEYLNGRVLGGTYVAGQGFSVPGLSVDATFWMSAPAAPAIPGADGGGNA